MKFSQEPLSAILRNIKRIFDFIEFSDQYVGSMIFNINFSIFSRESIEYINDFIDL